MASEGVMDCDKSYFKSYSMVQIHEEMIRDHSRTMSYKNAIFSLGDRIKGKIVADIGAGTGILSVFCAQAGASKVYAVEASDIAKQAKLVIEENKVDHIVTIVRGRVEEIELPEKVDIIVSEWMGYFLFYESMLDSVVIARDKWLKPGGIMLPELAQLYICPATDPEAYENKIEFWNHYPKEAYGISMSAMLPFAKQCYEDCVDVDLVESMQLLTFSKTPTISIDCRTITLEELSTLTGHFSGSVIIDQPFDMIVGWFAVKFPSSTEASLTSDSGARKKVCVETTLSTGPDDTPTHWRQTLFRLANPVSVRLDDEIAIHLSVSKDSLYKRYLQVHIKAGVSNKDNTTVEFSRNYRMTDGESPTEVPKERIE